MPLSRAVRLAVVLTVAGCWLAAGHPVAYAQVPGANGRIAFDSDRDGDFEIFTMAADGTDQRPLTDDPARDVAPVFSPDGSRIAFVSDRDGNPELYLMDADGTHQTRLTDDPGRDAGAAFSPDGTTIAFSSDRGGSDDLYTMGLDGSDLRRLTNGPSTQENAPAFSPDGTTIAFTSNGAAGDADVWTMPLKPRGGVPVYATRLTTSRAEDYRPSYSPDGRRIVFSSTRDLNGHSELYWMDAADGRHQLRLTRNAWDDETPSYSPDGQTIVSGGGGDVRVLGFLPVRNASLGRSDAIDEHPSWAALPGRLPVVPPFVLSGVRVVHGAHLRYRLSAPAKVRLTLTRLATGRTVGPVTLPGEPGANRFTVRRRLPHRTLSPGPYRVTLTATRADAEVKTRTVRITLRR